MSAELQEANFEKNRIKDIIKGDKGFEQLCEVVQKLQQVILLKKPGELTESERVLFDVLFRDKLGNAEAASN